MKVPARKIGWIALFSLTVSGVPLESNGQTPGDAFQSAIRAVENRNYEALEAILDSHPEVLNYTANPDCSLYCEFSQLFRAPFDFNAMTGIDVQAIDILLDRDANPALSPMVLSGILAHSNDFDGEVPEFPINSGECTTNRDVLFPLANRLIRSGARLDTIVELPTGDKYSIGFYYVYDLCSRPYICSAVYETVSPDIARNIQRAISESERDFIFRLVSGDTHNRECVSSALGHEGEKI